MLLRVLVCLGSDVPGDAHAFTNPRLGCSALAIARWRIPMALSTQLLPGALFVLWASSQSDSRKAGNVRSSQSCIPASSMVSTWVWIQGSWISLPLASSQQSKCAQCRAAYLNMFWRLWSSLQKRHVCMLPSRNHLVRGRHLLPADGDADVGIVPHHEDVADMRRTEPVAVGHLHLDLEIESERVIYVLGQPVGLVQSAQIDALRLDGGDELVILGEVDRRHAVADLGQQAPFTQGPRVLDVVHQDLGHRVSFL